MTGFLLRKWRQGDTHTERRHTERVKTKRGRDGSDTSRNQAIPRIAGNYKKLGVRHGTDSPKGAIKGSSPTNTVILDF